MTTFILIILVIMVSALFSGMEIAYVTSNRLKFELDRQHGNINARLLSPLYDRPSRYLATMLVGNNIALVLYGMLMASWLEPLLASRFESLWILLLAQTLISTIIILTLGEYLPKALFSTNSNKLLKAFSLPVMLFFVLLYPIVIIVQWLSDIFLVLVGKGKGNERPIFSRVDLDHFIRSATDENQEIEHLENEVQIFQNALDFDKIRVRECMVPRTEIVAVEVDSDIDLLRQKFHETGLGKILIYNETIDDIIGYVHSFELFKGPQSISQIIMPVPLMPETLQASEALDTLIQERKSLAVVIDEFGGTAGLVTIEDIIEKIFGDIEDEHDNDVLREETLGPNHYYFSTRLEIDYLNEKYKLGIPEEDDYETLGGFVMSHSERIPQEGETIEIQHYVFEVRKASGQRMEEVEMRVLAD
jgi:CBS domain containing-hemolysin-like protein